MGVVEQSNERRAAQRTQSRAAHEARKARGVERVAAPRGARVFARRVRVQAYTTLVRRTRPLRRDSSAPRDLVRSPSRFRLVLLFICDAHNQHRPKKHRARRPLVHLVFLRARPFVSHSSSLSYLTAPDLGFSFFYFFVAFAFPFSFSFSFFFVAFAFPFSSLSLFFFFGSEQTRSPVIFRGNERSDAWVRAKLKQRVHLRIYRRPKLDEARKSLIVQRVHFFFFSFLFSFFFSFYFFLFFFFLWVH